MNIREEREKLKEMLKTEEDFNAIFQQVAPGGFIISLPPLKHREVPYSPIVKSSSFFPVLLNEW